MTFLKGEESEKRQQRIKKLLQVRCSELVIESERRR